MKQMKSRLLPITLIVLIGLYVTSCTEETETLNDDNAVVEDTTEVVSAAEIDEIDGMKFIKHPTIIIA